MNDDAVGINSTIVRDTGIVFNQLDGETIMMSIENGEYYGMNAMGTRIWDLLETPRRVSEIRDALMPDFDVELEQCEKDILAFLNLMESRKVIKIVTG